MKGTSQPMERGREKGKKYLRVGLTVRICLLCAHMCVCTYSVCPCKTLGEESLLILALGHTLSFPALHPWISIHPPCRGSCGDEMRTDVYCPWWR